jgi:tetratricopeptide (TPR) repeat protein
MSAAPQVDLEAAIDAALAALRLDEARHLAERYLNRAGARPAGGAPAEDAWFRSRWLAAQVAVAAGDPAKALEYVRPLEPFAPRLPGGLACRLWLLVAEALARGEHRTEARAALDRVRVPPLADTCRAHPTLRLRAVRVGLWVEGVRPLADEVEECDRLLGTDEANRALLWCEAGRAWDAAGDLEQAARCWVRALALCPPGRNDPVRTDVLIQFGRLAHLRGELQPSLDRYEEALRIAPPQTPQRLEAELRRLLVWLELNQWDRARSRFDRLSDAGEVRDPPVEVRPLAQLAAALLGRAGDEGGGLEPEAYRAWQRGDRQTAFNLYRRAWDRADTPVRRARLALALGQLALLDGEEPEWRRWLEEAERLAREHALPEVLWRALEARGTAAAERDGDDAEARRYFEEAVAVSEEQARRLRHAADRPAYHLHRLGLLRLLLRGACRRGDAPALFRYQELDRGRLLCDLYREAGCRGRLPDESPRWEEIDRQLRECEGRLAGAGLSETARAGLRADRSRLLAERGRVLEEFLADRSRRADASLPGLPELSDLRRALPRGAVYVAPSLIGGELYLLVVRRGGALVHRAGGGAERLPGEVRLFRDTVDRALAGLAGSADLDARLDDFGRGPLGAALAAVLAPGERLVWVPDDALHGLPVAALRRRGRYLVEHAEVVHGFSGSLYVHQATHPPRSRRAWAGSLVVTESDEVAGPEDIEYEPWAPVLKAAAAEGDGVAAALFRARRLHGREATRERIRGAMTGARVAHFACHAYFDPRQALAAHLHLPSGEDWRTLAWLDEAFADLPLVTLSACRSAEVGPLVGREVFGLVTGVLAAGVRAVVAGLWPVADDPAPAFMWRLYRHRLTTDLATALARTQREVLRSPGSSPLDWAVFALFGDAAALPAPGLLGRLWGRWRQARHARRFPTSAASAAAVEAAW